MWHEMLCWLAAVIVLDVSFVQDRGAKRLLMPGYCKFA